MVSLDWGRADWPSTSATATAPIAIDVTDLSLDGAIRIADVKFPESAVLTLAPEEVIVTIAQPRVEVEAASEAAEEETTEVEVVTKGKAKEEEV